MTSLEKVLTRRVAEILPSREGLTKLMQQKKITLYLGIDPSNPQIHLGTAIALHKLREFQDLGHKVILLIGDFTGMIGDPTDKTATRKKLTRREILDNAKSYKDQASKIIKFYGPNKAEIKFNSDWLSRLTSFDWIELISNFTSGQLEERDMFVQRKKEGKPIYMHELIYPIMQGYDSVAMDVDLEVGGTDQTFNMLVGRELMKALKGKEKYVLTVPLLLGTDGQKMGKTTGNFIAIEAPPAEMYGKIMSIRDDLTKHYFELTTNLDLETIDFSQNPMLLKKRLAHEIVKMYHGEEAAKEVQEEFEKVFQEGQTPTIIPIVTMGSGATITQMLIETKSAPSVSETKRLIAQRAIEIDGRVEINPKFLLSNNQTVRIGKKVFVRVKIK